MFLKLLKSSLNSQLLISQASKAGILVSMLILASCGGGNPDSPLIAAAQSTVDLTTSASTITVGDTSTLTASFDSGTATIDNGVGNVTSGTAVTVSPAETTAYELTVTGTDGSTETSNVTITVVAVPTISSFNAAVATINEGESTELTAAFADGTANVSGIGGVQSGVAVTVSPTTTTTYELIVTNEAGTTVTGSVEVTVIPTPVPAPAVPAPIITQFSVNQATITNGNSATITIAYNNGTGSVDNGVGAVATSSSISVSPTVTTTYTLSVLGDNGTTITQQVTVTVIDAPVISSFTVDDADKLITNGDVILLTAVFTGGTATIDNSVGAASSGVGVSDSPAADITYLLTVTNAAGSAVTRSLSVSVIAQPVINSFTVDDNLITVGDIINLTADFTGGTASIDNSVGAVTSGNAVADTPAADIIYQLTVTNAAGFSVTLSRAVTVAGEPAILTFGHSDFDSVIQPGDSVDFTATFENADNGASIDQSVGNVTTGVIVNSGAIAVTTTFTLTITNAAGKIATANLELTVQAPAPSTVPSIRPIGSAQDIVLTFGGEMDTTPGTSYVLTGSLAADSDGGVWSTVVVTNNTLTISPNGANWAAVNAATLVIDVNDINGVAIATKTLTYDVLAGTLYFVNAAAINDSGNGLTVATAKQTIDAAIAAASNPATVVIAGGAYQKAGSIVLIEGISLYGGYSSEFISRNVSRSDNFSIVEDTSNVATSDATAPAAAIVAGAGISAATIIDGLQVKASRQNGVDHTAAVRVESGAALIIRNSTLSGGGNASTTSQAILSNGSAPSIYNNLLHGGVATSSVGINNIGAAGAVIRNNSIFSGTGSTSYGVDMSDAAAPEIDNNIIFTNAVAGSACIAESANTADAGNIRNNDLFSCSDNTTVFIDADNGCAGNSTCTLAELNALTNVSNNISIDPEFVNQDGNVVTTIDGIDWSLNTVDLPPFFTASPTSVTEGGLNGEDDGGWGFTTGYKDVARPATGNAWSIGAYQIQP